VPAPSHKPATGITIGIDLGDKKHTVCVIDTQGEVIEESACVNTREALKKLSSSYPSARIIVEVGMQSPWISRFLQSLSHEVIVANARKVRAICQNERKSDALDAMMLARIGRMDTSLLHPITHRSEIQQRDFLQIKLRDALVRQRVSLISSVRFMLKSLGVRLASPSTPTFAKHARTQLAEKDATLLPIIESTLQVLETLHEKIRELDHQIEQLCEQAYPQTQRLRQIPGVGPITALSYALIISDAQRFKSSRDVGPYLGLVPRRDQSGALDKQLAISKTGDAYLRPLLVGAAHYILGPFGPPSDLREHGLHLVARGGRGAKNKAAVAVARKLAVLMHALWQSGSEYEPQRRKTPPQGKAMLSTSPAVPQAKAA
jgi:transposase